MEHEPKYILSQRRVQRLIISAAVVLLALGLAHTGLKAALNVGLIVQQAEEER